MKTRYVSALVALLVLGGCNGNGAARGPRAIGTPDALSRATPGTRADVARTGAGILEQLGLPVAVLEPAAGRVLSETVVVQDTWGGVPVVERLLCGTPYPRLGTERFENFDWERATEMTAGTAIRVRLGFRSEPRVGGTTTRLIVEAEGQRPSLSPIFPSEIACLPTEAFVEQLFAPLMTATGT